MSISHRIRVTRRVPWYDWTEWRLVHRLIFSLVQTDQIRAMDIVTLWRVRGDVPLSVEATASLIQCHLAHSENRSEIELRHLFSMSIIRMVNGRVLLLSVYFFFFFFFLLNMCYLCLPWGLGLTAVEQKGSHSISVASIARKIQLPQLFVDIRHDATHSKLPSLDVSIVFASNSRLIQYHNHYDA